MITLPTVVCRQGAYGPRKEIMDLDGKLRILVGWVPTGVGRVPAGVGRVPTGDAGNGRPPPYFLESNGNRLCVSEQCICDEL